MSTTASMTSEQVIAKKLVGESLTLNDVTVNEIESNNIPTEPDSLITRSVLSDELHDIQRALKALDPEGDLFQDLSVISLSLVDTYFSNSEDWVLNNWSIVDNYMYYDSGRSSNSLGISYNRFSNPGHYYLLINVGTLSSGRLEVRLNSEWVYTIREAGEHIITVDITDPSSAVVDVVAMEVSSAETVRLDFFGLYFITDRFYKYFTNKIRMMSGLNPDDYVTTEAYEHQQDLLAQQFRSLTAQCLSQLTDHINANNPHRITPESIGAAAINHTHANYVSTDSLDTTLANKLRDYSPVGHEHSNYMTQSSAVQYIESTIGTALNEVKVIDPFIITTAPQGKLPFRYAQTDITPPLTILVPSIIAHTPDNTFDYTCGMVATNVESLIEEVPKVFSSSLSDQAHIPVGVLSSVVNFRIEFHHARKVAGYRVHCFGVNKLSDWKVINGNTTFIHRITNPSNYVTNGNDNVCEILFDRVQTLDSISFMFMGSYTGNDTEVRLKIEFIFNDLNKYTFGITNQEFSLCMPNNGSNYIYTKQGVNEIKSIAPAVIVDNIPMYVFAELTGNELNYNTSYIPIEVDNVRRGVNVLLDKFIDIPRMTTVIQEAYNHPAYGTLSLEAGTSDTNKELKTIYDSTYNSWYSNGSGNQVIIKQTILNNNVLLRGYILNWRTTDQNYIPDTWTLTIKGIDTDGNDVTVVYDSVDQYYPFYSVEDDDIVYHCKFDTPVIVKSVSLLLAAKTNRKIALNKLYLYLSERYYSVASNTLYLGNNPIRSSYLGTVIHNATDGWVVNNCCLGKTCTVPINNLHMVAPYSQYTVPNPFNTTDIVASVQNYVLTDAEAQSNPDAYVLSITADTITVFCNTPFRYGLSISRAW